MNPRRTLTCTATSLVFAFLLLVPVFAQRPSAPPTEEERLLAVMHGISSITILDYVKEMTSEKYLGRLTGTASYDASAAWAGGLLKGWKVKPANGQQSYLQTFPNPYTLVLPGAELKLHLPIAGGATIVKPYQLEQDYFPGSTSDSGTVTAEVVYVGYGATAPELNYDDYKGLDVKGKIVAMEPEVPVGPGPDAELFKTWRPYSFHDYKMKNAAAHGAVGVIYDYHLANPNCVFIKGLQLSYVSTAVMEDLFAGTGKKHTEVLSQIRKSLQPASMALGKTVTMKNVTEHHPEGIGSNIIAMVEGSDPQLKQEAIMVGAHLDHLGLNPELMPGAHDNASGVAVTLAVADAVARLGKPLKRSVVFILFGAEEQGVKGSEFYIAHPVIPNDKLKAFINLESVGRGERIGVGSGVNYPQIYEVMERMNTKWIHRPIAASANANLARPRQDAAHFLWANIPTVSIGVSGAPPLPYATYHTTKDRWELLSPETMEDLARLVFLSVVELANK
jgi:hypothetical protein